MAKRAQTTYLKSQLRRQVHINVLPIKASSVHTSHEAPLRLETTSQPRCMDPEASRLSIRTIRTCRHTHGRIHRTK